MRWKLQITLLIGVVSPGSGPPRFGCGRPTGGKCIPLISPLAVQRKAPARGGNDNSNDNNDDDEKQRSAKEFNRGLSFGRKTRHPAWLSAGRANAYKHYAQVDCVHAMPRIPAVYIAINKMC